MDAGGTTPGPETLGIALSQGGTEPDSRGRDIAVNPCGIRRATSDGMWLRSHSCLMPVTAEFHMQELPVKAGMARTGQLELGVGLLPIRQVQLR